jgi:hypothetical protein
MQLSIIGCPDKKRFRPFVKRAAIFYAEQLMTPKMLENIYVQIKFDPKLDALGYADVLNYNESNKPREFQIELNPIIGSHDILETLAHEMVHIKQYAYIEMNEFGTRWRGQRITENMDYYDEPWEIEAHGLSTGLFTKFAIKEKLWEVFSDVRNPDAPLSPEPIAWKNIPQITIDNHPI